ncbi:MAG: hypothetical protein DWP97_05155, partial [Calditrichaeota bacterium]
TVISIIESRKDSYQLLVRQGEAYIESLSSAASNAIEAEQFYDYMAHQRYNEITIELDKIDKNELSEQLLYQTALTHNLYAVYEYDTDSTLIVGAVARGSQLQLPQYVVDEVLILLANPDNNYTLLLNEDSTLNEAVHYYLKLSNTLDRVTVLVAEASYFQQALEQTEISFLAQQIAGQRGISYIIYQSDEGIIFSSRKISELVSIDDDEFLKSALESDSIVSRKYIYDDDEILELVRPFSSSDYPFGLLRVGLSLSVYNSILYSYNLQMIVYSLSLFLFVILLLIYLNSRTKRQEITAQYEEIKSLSDKIFDEMDTGVAAINAKGLIYFTNDAFNKIFDLNGQSDTAWDKLISDDELQSQKFIQSSKEIIDKEIKFKTDNQFRYLLIVMSKMQENIDESTSIVVVVYDVTSMHDLEQKAARKERLSEMGNLAAGVAHEIRNPLNTISIAAQRLAAEFKPIEDIDEYLSFTSQIREETKRLNTIITKFLALARGEAQKTENVNLHSFTKQFVDFAKSEAEDLQITLQFEIDKAHIVSIEADKLRQVYSNLYNNAKEALAGSSGVIRITSKAENDQVLLTFEDSGPGVEDAIREKIFTPYYTTKEAGTGLGLPTIHTIISDNGGDVIVEKSELGGAKFILTLRK